MGNLISFAAPTPDRGWEYRLFVRAPSGATEESERQWALSHFAPFSSIFESEHVPQPQLTSWDAESRTDYYIQTTSVGQGLKLRGSCELELKQRLKVQEFLELWEKPVKLYFPYGLRRLDEAVKTVRDVGFAVESRGKVVEVRKFRAQMKGQGLKIEATAIFINGGRWRTVCLEGTRETVVRKCVERIKEFIDEGESMGYPEWIEGIVSGRGGGG